MARWSENALFYVIYLLISSFDMLSVLVVISTAKIRFFLLLATFFK